ncbi:MAG: ABC transporter permease [Bacteroidales bacterium]|nr:ABC transporter permease [Bacteroidales bacterium]
MKTLNYSIRYLLKNRGNSATRVISLSLGLIVALLIFSFVGLKLSYNRFFPDKERIYQVWTISPRFSVNGVNNWMVMPLAPNMANDIPQIEAATHYIDNLIQINHNGNNFDVSMFKVNSDFFEVLDFGVISGDPRRVLSEEGRASKEVMISKRLSDKLFGNEDPLGKVIETTTGGKYIVGGVFKTPPVNNTIGDFDVLYNLNYDTDDNIWTGNDSYPTFIKLRAGCDIAEVEAQMDEFVKRYPDYKFYVDTWQVGFSFVPIDKSMFFKTNEKQTSILMGTIGFVAMLIACLNYVLLTISSLSQRSKTIAMLRCNGARRSDIFNMLINETLLILFVAILLSILIIMCLSKEISQMFFDVKVLFSLERIWIPAMVCIVAFLIAGLIPAAMFSSVRLHYAFRGGAENRKWWKKILLFVQMACTTFIVIFLGIMMRQYNYVLTADYGYKYDKIMTVCIPGTTATQLTIRDELLKQTCVEDVGISLGYPIWGYSGNPIYDAQWNLLFSCRWEIADEHYIPTMQMKIVEGRNYTATDAPNKVLVNESFAEYHGFTDNPIGKVFYKGDGGTYEIIGVVADYQMCDGWVEPIVIHPFHAYYDENRVNSFQFNIRMTDFSAENINTIKSIIDEFYTSEWQYSFVTFNDRMKDNYYHVRHLRNIVLIVTLVTLIITLIGLIGYLGDEMQSKRREIAIRKVCGATVMEVIKKLSLNLSLVMLPAIATGVIAAVIGGRYYLEMIMINSNLITSLSFWIFLAGVTLVIFIIYVVNILYSWKAANENPVDVL